MRLKKFLLKSKIHIIILGVIGKGYTEKLLRSCNVKKIYLLLRPKKNLSIEERITKLRNGPVS